MTQEQLSKQLKDWAEVKEIRKKRGIPELGPDDKVYDTAYIRETI